MSQEILPLWQKNLGKCETKAKQSKAGRLKVIQPPQAVTFFGANNFPKKEVIRLPFLVLSKYFSTSALFAKRM